ncbi:hypothetical protein ACFYXJ_31695 [Streptomyces sp. NPDC002667]|uniref:hypothetical protein n=1 Tax=Streptomyces sp. NPDC002667 TaxID=3364657 RepID=UPI0036827256
MSGSTDSKPHDRTTRDRETGDSGVRTPPEPDAETPTPAPTPADPDAEDLAPAPTPADPDAEDPAPAGPDAEGAGGEEGSGEEESDDDAGDEDRDPEVRRARWIAVGTGALLTVAGLAASVMRTSVSGTVLVPLSYASGAVLCAGASVLGAKGRTRRALFLMIAGVMVMAVGDQLD